MWCKGELKNMKYLIVCCLVLMSIDAMGNSVTPQTYYDNGTLINKLGVQCDVAYCDKFTDDDDVVFISYDVIKNIKNGAVCNVECGDVIQDSVEWYLWSFKF